MCFIFNHPIFPSSLKALAMPHQPSGAADGTIVLY